MNNEIKEILDRLERIDHKEYSCGFEFADSSTFDEIARCFKERKKMANYITNLQQENEELKKNQRYYKKGVFCLEYDKETMSDIIDDYKQRIDKAIEYIEENKVKAYPVYGDYTDTDFEINLNAYEVNDLLNILNGSDE